MVTAAVCCCSVSLEAVLYTKTLFVAPMSHGPTARLFHSCYTDPPGLTEIR